MKPASVPPTRRLAVCIDDIGLHDGVDAAALRLFDQGRINTVSVLSEGMSWREAAAALRDRPASALDVGLHFNLTESVGQAPALGGLGAVIARSYLRALSRTGLRDRFERQLDAFVRMLGRAPSHVDGHQHIHQLPGVRDVVLDGVERHFGTGPRPWLRACRARPLPAPDTPDGGAATAIVAAAARKARLIETLGAGALDRAARARGHALNGALLGVYNLQDTRAQFPVLLDAWLAAAQDGDLLMCHPALATPGDGLAATRQAEFDLLGGPTFGDLVTQHRIVLQPLSRTLNPG